MGESEALELCKWMECYTPCKNENFTAEVPTSGLEEHAHDPVPRVLISLEATLPIDNHPCKDEHPRVAVQDDT